MSQQKKLKKSDEVAFDGQGWGALVWIYTALTFFLALAVLIGFCKCGAEAAMDDAMEDIIDMMEEERMMREEKVKDISHASISTN